VKSILADIDSHAADQPQGDDMTIVAMSIEQRRAKRKTTTLPGVAITDLGSTQLRTDKDPEAS
jgi:hypothetical protein